MKLCVIIPVHNEAAEIGRIVTAIRQKKLDVVVIDDGSSDDSGYAAASCGAHVLTHQERQGKGLSLQEGFAYALQNNYRGVITMDGDGQHDVSDIDSFLDMIAADSARIINGTRMNGARGMPLIRLMTNRVMSGVISFICKQRIPDSQCGFRYIPAEALESIRLKSRDFEIETEVLIKASRRGYSIVSTPIKTIYRNEKSKINPVKDTVRFFVYLAKELKGDDESLSA